MHLRRLQEKVRHFEHERRLRGDSAALRTIGTVVNDFDQPGKDVSESCILANGEAWLGQRFCVEATLPR